MNQSVANLALKIEALEKEMIIKNVNKDNTDYHIRLNKIRKALLSRYNPKDRIENYF